MSAEQNINPQDYELLTAYIDGELTDAERVSLEQRLAKESFLQQELNSLRSTVSLIHTLPPMTAPRDFTLTEAMVSSPKIIPFKPRRRMQPSYLSLVASVLLMLFGLMFMLTEFGDMQSLSAELSAPSQSDSALEKTAPPIVADAPPNNANLQAERAIEEPTILDATLAEELEEIPADSNDTVMNQSAPSIDERDDEFRQEDFGSDAVDTTADGMLLYSVEASSEVDETALDNDTDGYSIAGETQALDDIAEQDLALQDAPQPMAASGFADMEETLTDTASTGSEAPNINDASGEGVLDEAESDDVGEPNEVLGRVMSAVSDVTSAPPPESTVIREREQAPTTQAFDNSQIGIVALIIGFVLFIVSIFVIRRNRS